MFDARQIEKEGLTVEELKEMYENDIKRYEALKRLYSNPDFVYLINEEFFQKEAVNVVKIADSEESYMNERLKMQNDAKLIAISGLQRWFENVIRAGRIAPEEIEVLEKGDEEEENFED
jgi:uncharacterized protein YihD (DUF1040 family)